MVRGIIWSAR